MCIYIYQGYPRIKVLEHSIPSTTNGSLIFHQLVLLYKPFINIEDPN